MLAGSVSFLVVVNVPRLFIRRLRSGNCTIGAASSVHLGIFTELTGLRDALSLSTHVVLGSSTADHRREVKFECFLCDEAGGGGNPVVEHAASCGALHPKWIIPQAEGNALSILSRFSLPFFVSCAAPWWLKI